MKNLLVVTALVTFVGSTVFAAEVISLQAKIGDVTYNHKLHSKKADCKLCHKDAPYGAFSLDKDQAHTVCKDCHIKQGGPTKCDECHER